MNLSSVEEGFQVAPPPEPERGRGREREKGGRPTKGEQNLPQRRLLEPRAQIPGAPLPPPLRQDGQAKLPGRRFWRRAGREAGPTQRPCLPLGQQVGISLPFRAREGNYLFRFYPGPKPNCEKGISLQEGGNSCTVDEDEGALV